MTTSSITNKPPVPVTESWVRFRSVGYLIGRGLSFGVGDDLFPRVATAPGKFSLNVDILPNPKVTVCDGRLDLFTEGSFDHIVVGPSLGACPNPASFMRDIVSKLKQGGHLVFYLKKNFAVPNSPICSVFDESAMRSFLETSGAWRLKYQDTRGEDMLLIAKKVAGQRGTILPIKPKAPKRACIVRYGALGDMVMITPLIKKLHEDGYEVTMNITPYATPIIENNPHVGNIVFQEREAIPNKDLGPYWDEWKTEYDKYINLSESIEGKLLKVEGRRDYFTSKEWRHKVCGSTNYYDWTMELGGYPEMKGGRGELFFTPQERKEALKLKKEYEGKFVIGWGVNGSSYHKIYPLTEPVLDDFLEKHPDVVVFLLGGPDAQRYEFDHPQVVRTCGQWPLRKTLAFIAFVADAIVGPESMVMNVAGCYDIPKVVFLSHSVHENLCKYWAPHDYCMMPDTDVAACYPCHQLHYSLESCPQAEIRDLRTKEVIARGPVCAMGAINGIRVIDRLEEVYGKYNVVAKTELSTV